MVSFILLIIFAEFRFIVVQYVESDLDDIFNMQRPDCFVCFFFLRTCTDEPMVFFHELYEVSVFVLIMEMISFISL